VGSGEAEATPVPADTSMSVAPLRVLVIDKMSVVRKNRERFIRLARRANVEITLLAPTVWVENVVRTEFEPGEDEPIDVVLGRVSWPGNEIKSIYLTGLLKALRRSRPEVVFMFEEAFSLFAIQIVTLCRLLYPKTPVIFYGLWILPYRQLYFRPRPLIRGICRAVFKMVHLGLCLNDRATQMVREAGFHNARTLFFGIDEEIFQPVEQAEARRRLGIAPSEELFLFAGRLREEKGIQDLITAFARIRSERPGRPLQLVIVGDGDYLPQLRELAASLDLGTSVVFRNAVPIDEMRLVIASATALVLPSRSYWAEQFGRVLVEAMLVGTTVIGSTSGEIPNVVGDGGFVFDADDVNDLEKTIKQVLDNPEEAERRRMLGHEKAIAQYSMGAFVEGLIDTFEELSGRRLRQQLEDR
jgi:glycosyltransferase involved in cell wall biosynthesis